MQEGRAEGHRRLSEAWGSIALALEGLGLCVHLSVEPPCGQYGFCLVSGASSPAQDRPARQHCESSLLMLPQRKPRFARGHLTCPKSDSSLDIL